MALTALLGVDDRIRLDLRGGGPHGRHAQHRALLVPGALVHLHDCIPEEGQQVVVERTWDLEGALGDPAVLLQHGKRLAENCVERHGGPSTYEIALWDGPRVYSSTPEPGLCARTAGW